MALTQIDDRGLKTPIDLLDNEKIRLGTGNDLELYHSGSASYIDAGTTATELISDDLRLRSKTGNETYINADVNGAVELYHDNTLRFLTNSIGAQCQGDFSIPLDNEELRIGAGNDFRVKHDGTNTIMSNNTGALYISGDDIRLTNAATDESYIKGVANGAVELYYDNSKKFETISTGVKVQSSAAHCHLKINSANSNSSVIHFGTAADDDMAQIWYDDYSDALYYRTSTNTPQIFYTNNAERMRIDSSGNVGIGTTSPRSLLDLGAGSGDGALSSTLSQYQIMLEAPQGEGDYGRNIGWSVGTNGLTAAINAVDVGAGDATGLTFITGTNSSVAERMRIDSSGNVGIGEATPLAQLHIKPATNKSQLLLEQNNAVDGYALFQDGPNGGHLKFMRHVNGTETQKLLLRNDGGLCFGTDSATANALDDYEEGTWTPDLTRWTGSNWWSNTWDTAPTTNVGFYRKVGNVVYITFDIGGFDVGSTTDGRYVGMNGLPFASTSTTGNAGHLVVTYSTNVFETDTATSFWVSNGGTTTTTNRFGDDNGSHNTYSSGSNKRLRGQGFYFTS